MLPGLLISAVALVIVFYCTGVNELGAAIRYADYRYFPFVLILFFLAMAARGFAWKTLLGHQVSFRHSFMTLNEGYVINNLLPARLGEFGRPLLLSGKTDLDYTQILATIVIERIFDLMIVAGMLMSTLPFVIGAEWARSAALTVSMFVFLGLVMLYLMARNRDAAIRLYERISLRWPRLQRFGQQQLSAFFSGLETLTDGKRFFVSLLWMVLAWGFALGHNYILLLAFVDNAQLLWAAFALASLGLGVAIPSSPAFVGVFEATIMAALALFGVDTSAALAYAITLHLLQVILTAIPGVYEFVQDGVSLGQIYRQIRTRNREPEIQE